MPKKISDIAIGKVPALAGAIGIRMVFFSE